MFPIIFLIIVYLIVISRIVVLKTGPDSKVYAFILAIMRCSMDLKGDDETCRNQ